MQEEIFKNLIGILDKEIKLYTEMRNLYTEKKEILIKNNILELSQIDTKILENYEAIKKIDILRLDAIKMLGEDIMSMSALIEIAEERAPKFALKLKEQQAKLNNLSSTISVLNLTTMKLLKHGMVITDKKLNIIIEACAPKGTSYNLKGVEDDKNLEMSTIIKDV